MSDCAIRNILKVAAALYFQLNREAARVVSSLAQMVASKRSGFSRRNTHADVVSNVVNRIGESLMKPSIRQAIWILALAFAVTAFVTPKLAAAYQTQQDHQDNQANSKDNANNLMYQQGFDHGQADRANNQPHQYRLQPKMRTTAVPMNLD